MPSYQFIFWHFIYLCMIRILYNLKSHILHIYLTHFFNLLFIHLFNFNHSDHMENTMVYTLVVTAALMKTIVWQKKKIKQMQLSITSILRGGIQWLCGRVLKKGVRNKEEHMQRCWGRKELDIYEEQREVQFCWKVKLSRNRNEK